MPESMDCENAQEFWGIVEVMGHSQYAGRLSQHSALGVALLRVEVPAVDGTPAFEKLLGGASIFAITPCTEALARAAAARFKSRPFTLLDLAELGSGPRQLTLIDGEDDGRDYGGAEDDD